MGRRDEYLKERKELGKLSVGQLEKLLDELGVRRFDENDISIENEYRMTSSVYLQKVKKGDTLIFHLRNFLGALLFSLIFSIFIIYK